MRQTPPERPRRACREEVNDSQTTRRAQNEAEVLPAGIKPTELPSDNAAAPATQTLDTAAASAIQNRSKPRDALNENSVVVELDEEDSKTIEHPVPNYHTPKCMVEK